MIFAGMIYSWSVFSMPIAAEFSSWNKVQLSFTFTLIMISFCVGCIVGGFLNKKLKIRSYLLLSAALFLSGFFIASRTHSLLGLYLGFGVLCGLASGLIYNGVMSTMSCWFPEKQGFISGMLLMAFGIGSFLIGNLFQAFTPAVIGAWRSSFLFLGCLIFVIYVLCSFVCAAPPEGFAPPAVSKSKKRFANPVATDVSTKEMMSEKTFWLYYLWAIAISIAGLSIVSQAGFIAREVSTTAAPGTVATVVGLISVFNGIGRILTGMSFDRYGRRATMRVIDLGFLVTAGVLIMAINTKSFSLLVLGFILGGLSYGGVTPTNSAFINSYFGNTHFPINFSIINSNMIIASFGSTIAGALYDATHSYVAACCLMIGMTVLAAIFSNLISFSYNKKIANDMELNSAVNAR
jgi:Sugar phosphate permease